VGFECIDDGLFMEVKDDLELLVSTAEFGRCSLKGLPVETFVVRFFIDFIISREIKFEF